MSAQSANTARSASAALRPLAWLDADEDTLAFRCHAHAATRRELRHAARRAAAWLAQLGVRRGDVIALWLPDGGTWLQILFAAAQLGVLVVPVSTRYRLNEARHSVATAKAKVLLVATDFLGVDFVGMARDIQKDVPTLAHVIAVEAPSGFLPVDPGQPDAPDSGLPTDPLCTFSTSGTTGNPKLAVHDQHGIARHGENVAKRMGIHAGDVMLCALSLYGVLGFVQAVAALAGGASIVFLQMFKADEAAAAIERFRVTHFFGSDGIFDPVLGTGGHDLSSWRVGGFAEFAGLGPKVIEMAQSRLGLRLFGIYGSSETFALTAAQSMDDRAEQRLIAGGVPVAPEIECRAVDLDNGEPVGEGVHGELQIRGYNVMSGYLNNEEATRAALTRDGWYRTGDLGFHEGGQIVYLARLKDSLRLKGYLVDPGEIEEHLRVHPAVSDAQVVGVHRPGEGDVAVAFVRASAGASEQALLDHCRSGMASYKLPRRIVFVAAFPTMEGPNGTKILKNKLRDMAESALAGA